MKGDLMMRAAIHAIRTFWTRSIRRQLMLGIALVHAVLMTIFIVDLVERQRTFLNEQGIAANRQLGRNAGGEQHIVGIGQ